MPVRNLKPSYRGLPSRTKSLKAGNRHVFGESTLERDLYILFEFFLWVVSYEEQPLTLPYLDVDEKLRKYTPDTQAHLRIDGHDEQWLYEVKYRADLWAEWNELRWKFRGAVRYCRENGFDRFKILTEKEIRGPKLDNIKRFLKKRSAVVDPVLKDFMLKLLEGGLVLDVRTVLMRLRDQGIEENTANVALSHLIATHKIGLDLDVPFTY
ncbi:MAG: TnsA endonuclease N-terminal domain-containing protein, partial [Desulfobacterales bacterium]